MYNISTLNNGLRLVTVTMPHSYSISLGVYLAVGSRYEAERLAGASHFIEHMLFKGTTRRPTPRDIALSVECVGGDINASTGRESTSYYARVSRDDLQIATDVLLDMVRNSRFAPSDIERERQVITEEINESLDLPDDLAHMQLQALLWPGHPLAQDVAGTRESVGAMSRDDLLGYMAQGYTPARTVITVAGPVSHAQVEELVAPLLGGWDGNSEFPTPPAPAATGPSARALFRPVEQSHLLLGSRAPSRFDKERFAFSLMTTLLGDGMSSRLFTEIREERALAYSVYAYVSQLADTGQFAVYAGVDSDNLHETIEAVQQQLHRLREEPVGVEELAMTKAYARGRTLLRLEDSGANAGWVGSQLLLTDSILTPEEVLGQLDAVTPEDIQAIARHYFRDDALTMSIVGPVDEDADWAGLLGVE